MKSYKCPRCAYETDLFANYKAHLQRKFPCASLFSTLDPSDILNALVEEKRSKKHCCEICKTSFSSRQAKYRHSKVCTVQDYITVPKQTLISLEKGIGVFEKFIT